MDRWTCRRTSCPASRRPRGSDLNEPCGVAVDASGIYWSDAIGGAIGHANLDGTGERTLLTGVNRACGVALGGGYLYWDNEPYTGTAPTMGERSIPGPISTRTTSLD